MSVITAERGIANGIDGSQHVDSTEVFHFDVDALELSKEVGILPSYIGFSAVQLADRYAYALRQHETALHTDPGTEVTAFTPIIEAVEYAQADLALAEALLIS